MTWTKLSDDFGRDCERAGLSDAAFRLHVEAHLWCNEHETDGRFTFRDLRRLASAEDVDPIVGELFGAGFWQMDGRDLLLIHHQEHQLERDVLVARRRADNERQERKRHRDALAALGVKTPERMPADELKRLLKEHLSRRDSCSDSQSDVMRDPGRDGKGREGPAPIEGDLDLSDRGHSFIGSDHDDDDAEDEAWRRAAREFKPLGAAS